VHDDAFSLAVSQTQNSWRHSTLVFEFSPLSTDCMNLTHARLQSPMGDEAYVGRVELNTMSTAVTVRQLTTRVRNVDGTGVAYAITVSDDLC